MMFGVGKTYTDHIELFESCGSSRPDRQFPASIPWTFQKENTVLDGKVEEAGASST